MSISEPDPHLRTSKDSHSRITPIPRQKVHMASISVSVINIPIRRRSLPQGLSFPSLHPHTPPRHYPPHLSLPRLLRLQLLLLSSFHSRPPVEKTNEQRRAEMVPQRYNTVPRNTLLSSQPHSRPTLHTHPAAATTQDTSHFSTGAFWKMCWKGLKGRKGMKR